MVIGYCDGGYYTTGLLNLHIGETQQHSHRVLKFQFYQPDLKGDILTYHKDPERNGIRNFCGVITTPGSTLACSLARPIASFEPGEGLDGEKDGLLSLARTWYNNCLGNHTRCQEKSNFIPTRVIDVGPEDGSADPFLYTTTENDKSKPYLALSYCWGSQTADNRNLTTTEATFHARTRGMSMEEFPSCCRDAIAITRKLSFQFLWIDAVCILQQQESGKDWSTESAQMADIYANSAITISAGAGNRCDSSIFKPRPKAHVGIQLEFEGKAGQREIMGFREWPGDLGTVLEESEIYQRGWTTQERMLSGRILHFTPQQAYWQCSEEEHGEDGRNKAQMKSEGSSKHRLHLRQDVDEREMRTRWYEIMSAHKQKKFSIPTDLLPSLAGMAKAYQPRFNSTYIAGHWESHLPQSLLWIGHYEKLFSPVSPSWSWITGIGLSYGYGYRTSGGEAIAKVEYFTVDVDSEEAKFLGHSESARIGLLGNLKKLTYRTNASPYGSCIRWIIDAGAEFCGEPEYHSQEEAFLDGESYDGQSVSIDFWGFAISVSTDYSEASWFYQLLLLEEVGEEKLVFKRRGVAILSVSRFDELFGTAKEESIVLI